MITVEIFDDGSGLETWTHSSGPSTSAPLTPAQVQAGLNSPCINNPRGCGGCLTCAVKAGWEKRQEENIRNRAREYLNTIDENDFAVDPTAPVVFVESGAWVQCAVWIPTNEED